MAVIRSAPGQSVTFRALSLLDAFDETHQVLTLTQIARRSGLPLATAQRRLRDLTDGRLIAHRSDGLFEIGARMWHLGLLSRPTSMREAALPHLQDLVLRTGRTVHMAVLDGHAALVIDRIGGSHAILTRHHPGARIPLYCTAVGKTLLAFAPEHVQAQTLEAMVPHTQYTVTDPKRVREQLEAVRRNRLAESHQQNRLGVCSIAAPVFSSAGLVVAGIGILAPTETALQRYEEALRACTKSVAKAVEARDREWDAD